ncbi:MAG TPA: helix-turn-helix domain-containing protein [Gaiellaceae bacterium]|nr:helix-turn-helix domain-containing protein [Gaiellaceae bacterium]
MSADRCYLLEEALRVLQMPRRTFYKLKKKGLLPCVVECTPRLGRRPRFRADLIDRYVAGQFGQPRAFSSHRRSA